MTIKTKAFKVKITLLDPMLGSQPGDKELASNFIAKKKGLDHLPENDDEILPEMIEKGTTVFYRLPSDKKKLEKNRKLEKQLHGMPMKPEPQVLCLMNYQLLGFLKEAGKVLNGRLGDGNGGKLKNLRSKIEDFVFVSPRHLPLHLPDGEEMDYCERPLRAATAMGEMTALARSEMVPAGTWFVANIEVLEGSPISQDVLETLLDYGFHRGLGSWRNSGAFGTFRYELMPEAE